MPDCEIKLKCSDDNGKLEINSINDEGKRVAANGIVELLNRYFCNEHKVDKEIISFLTEVKFIISQDSNICAPMFDHEKKSITLPEEALKCLMNLEPKAKQEKDYLYIQIIHESIHYLHSAIDIDSYLARQKYSYPYNKKLVPNWGDGEEELTVTGKITIPTLEQYYDKEKKEKLSWRRLLSQAEEFINKKNGQLVDEDTTKYVKEKMLGRDKDKGNYGEDELALYVLEYKYLQLINPLMPHDMEMQQQLSKVGSENDVRRTIGYKNRTSYDDTSLIKEKVELPVSLPPFTPTKERIKGSSPFITSPSIRQSFTPSKGMGVIGQEKHLTPRSDLVKPSHKNEQNQTNILMANSNSNFSVKKPLIKNTKPYVPAITEAKTTIAQ